MKKIISFLFVLILPFAGISQKYHPSDFSGVITFDENKTIDFNYLNNPVCGTNISYFNHLPVSSDFEKNMKQNLLPFSRIKKIELLEFTDRELDSLKNFCPDCYLRKAKVYLSGTGQILPEPVFVVLKQLVWKSQTLKDVESPRIMEARFIEKITINVKSR